MLREAVESFDSLRIFAAPSCRAMAVDSAFFWRSSDAFAFDTGDNFIAMSSTDSDNTATHMISAASIYYVLKSFPQGDEVDQCFRSAELLVGVASSKVGFISEVTSRVDNPTLPIFLKSLQREKQILFL
jgi:hypothetical protein